MKRPLRILGEPTDRTPADPVGVKLGTKVLSVVDAHDGAAASQLGELLVQAGARYAELEADTGVDFHIVVRSTPQSPEAYLRSEVLEETADLVLGSVRPTFVRLLARSLGAAGG